MAIAEIPVRKSQYPVWNGGFGGTRRFGDPFLLVTYLSNEKMRFQSFFMPMTVHPFFVASSYSA
jgi:hypothetical protein